MIQPIRLLALVVALAGAQTAWKTAAIASFDQAWATINETFYDPAFGGVDWVAVRDELRPRAVAAESAEGARDVIRAMLARLGRSHFALLSGTSEDDKLPGEAVVPIDVRVTDAGALVTRVRVTPGDARGLRAGQVLLSIDDWRVPSVAAPGDRDLRAPRLDAWRAINRRLHGAAGSAVRLRVRDRTGDEREVRVGREVAPGELVSFGNLPTLRVQVEAREERSPAGRRVGVIAFGLWMAAINLPVARAVDDYRSADGLVIDLRGNPGGLADMMRGIAGHIVDEPVLLGRMRMRSLPNPLEFKANPRRSTPDGRSVVPFAGRVAVLVDELTASTSECFAGGLQSLGRVRVFGRQTSGQALPALTKRLPNGDALMYVVGDFVTSAGRPLEGEGVVPDEVVALTPEAFATSRDPDLEAALRWLDLAQPVPAIGPAR